MKGILILGMNLLMVSCVFIPLTPERVRTLSDYDVCMEQYRLLTTSSNRFVLENEAKRRGIYCDPALYHSIIQSNINTSLWMMQQSQQMMQPPPQPQWQWQQPIRCTSWTDSFGFTHTNCR